MLKEAPILSGDERLLCVRGNIAERRPDAPVAGLEHLSVSLTLGVQYCAHARQFPALEDILSRKIRRCAVEEFDDVLQVDDRIDDRLVFAELVVRRVQIGEIEAVKNFSIGADCFGIIKRGRYQIINIDRLDIELLLHVGAAIAQNLDDIVLILERIEVRLDGLRLSHHLAERKRGGKNLDEDRIHRTHLFD